MQLLLGSDPPPVPRHGLNLSHFRHRGERIVVLDVIMRFDLRTDFEAKAIDPFDAKIAAIEDCWLFRC